MQTDAQTWGNPATQAFRKRNIRQVNQAGTQVLVNRKILDHASKLIAEATGPLPPKLRGWQPVPESGTMTRAQYGLTIEAHPSLPEGHGFTRDEAGVWLVFTGDPSNPSGYSATATKKVLAQVAGEFRHQSERWSTAKPGEREPGLGDSGDDVQFFQLVYNAPNQSGTLTPGDVDLIMMLQNRWGIPKTGTITRDTWRCVLPHPRSFALDYGDSGRLVTVLQCLLVAYDWVGEDDELVICGRFDQATSRTLAKVQHTYRLRETPHVGAPEWAALIGQWPF